MPDDRKPPTDVRLSPTDVRRVLERAAKIDATQPTVSVSDVAQAAHEAGISQHAVIQAVSELLDAQQLATPGDTSNSVTEKVRSGLRLWVRAATLSIVFVIALIVITAILRLFP